jgi:hypothetical protein
MIFIFNPDISNIYTHNPDFIAVQWKCTYKILKIRVISSSIGEILKREKKMISKHWEERLQTIESYLQSIYPEYVIERVKDPLRSQLFTKYFFRIKDAGGNIRHRFSVSYDFLDHHAANESISYFEKWQVKRLFEKAGRNEILATNDGIRVIRRKK